jgi:hypothetical protein
MGIGLFEGTINQSFSKISFPPLGEHLHRSGGLEFDFKFFKRAFKTGHYAES